MEIPENFHFTQTRRVEFSDTDRAGIVHFTNFLRYAEATEHAFWRSLGRSVHTGEGEDQHGWPRISVSCDFTKPALFEQLLNVCIRIEEVRNTTLRYGFWIFDDEGTESGLVAVGQLTIIHVGLDPSSGKIRKVPIPDDLKEQLESLSLE
jgi:YbgC/YbaW family acyl-CoA thioester hydrolase